MRVIAWYDAGCHAMLLHQRAKRGESIRNIHLGSVKVLKVFRVLKVVTDSYFTALKDMSRLLMEWVRAPTLTKSTPVSA